MACSITGIWLLFALVDGDYLRAASYVGAALVAFVFLRRGMRRIALFRGLSRLRLWWLRRRYKVIEGGKPV